MRKPQDNETKNQVNDLVNSRMKIFSFYYFRETRIERFYRQIKYVIIVFQSPFASHFVFQ